EACVRVDPPPPGLRDRRPTLEGQARRVREEVPYRRAGRAGGLVEVDRPFLGCDESRERGHRLRHRRPPKETPRVAAARPYALVADDGDRDVPGRPAVDLPERLHGGRY